LEVSLLIDEYRKNWAIRFLREAKSDLSTADKTPIPAMSVSFAVMAMRKAQTSVYYSIGDPSYLTPMVNEVLEGKRGIENPTMKLLADMELMIQSCINGGERLGKDIAIRNARTLIELASKIASLITKGKVVEFA
jgi:hypothetical protein